MLARFKFDNTVRPFNTSPGKIELEHLAGVSEGLVELDDESSLPFERYYTFFQEKGLLGSEDNFLPSRSIILAQIALRGCGFTSEQAVTIVAKMVDPKSASAVATCSVENMSVVASAFGSPHLRPDKRSVEAAAGAPAAKRANVNQDNISGISLA